MTLNLTELKDEPLGKHPIQADLFVFPCALCMVTETEQGVVAADDESSFTFDVDGLSDEALEPRPGVLAFNCAAAFCPYGGNIYDCPEQGSEQGVAIRNPI